MNVAARQPIEWTADQYLAWEAQQEARYETDGFEPVAMVGGKIAHQRIIRAGERALRRRTRCEVFSETVKFQVADNKFRYPDLMVVCSQPSGEATFVTDPVVVIGVLSDGNADDDRITKNQEYSMVPSVQHYVMLEQNRPAATMRRNHVQPHGGRLDRPPAGWRRCCASPASDPGRNPPWRVLRRRCTRNAMMPAR